MPFCSKLEQNGLSCCQRLSLERATHLRLGDSWADSASRSIRHSSTLATHCANVFANAEASGGSQKWVSVTELAHKCGDSLHHDTGHAFSPPPTKVSWQLLPSSSPIASKTFALHEQIFSRQLDTFCFCTWHICPFLGKDFRHKASESP